MARPRDYSQPSEQLLLNRRCVIQDVFQVFIWMFALGAAVAIPASLRKSSVAFTGWLILYLLGYAFLSVNGHYAHDVRARSERWVPLFCGGVTGTGASERPRLNAAGAFFGPLVLADRIIVHRAKAL